MYRSCIQAMPVPFVAALAISASGSDECRLMADEKTNPTVSITVKDKATELKLSKGDVFELKMEMRAGTGYSWHVAKNDKELLELVGKPAVERPDDSKPGAPSLQVFRFRAKAAGTDELELHYRRPFEKDKPPEKTYKLTLQIK